MRVLILAEYYPRAAEPALGIWAHRQTLAAREAGAEVRVLVLHRPLPPLSALRHRDLARGLATVAQPSATVLDGVRVDYVRYLSPPRPWSYASWGAWAAPWLGRAVRRLREEYPFDLLHAHYAVPSGDAVRRALPHDPLVVSVHGGDVHGAHADRPAVRATFAHARLVLANSAGTAQRCRDRGAARVRVVHLGTDPAPGDGVDPPDPGAPRLVSVGNLIARKGHADVLEALARLRARHPTLRYEVVGEGPERAALTARAGRLGLADRVTLRGALPHEAAVAVARSATVFVLPSVEEAFGVSYIEAMAAGVPAVGCAGEDGPEEIAAVGGGMALVAAHDPAALAAALDRLLSDPTARAQLGAAARANVERNFTWEACGRATLEAYREALSG